MHCDYFDAGQCRSCTLMGTAYTKQLTAKQDRAREALAAVGVLPEWSAPFASQESGFRNKAKLVIAGTVDSPTLGILDPVGNGMDLRSCGLYDRACMPCSTPWLPSSARRVSPPTTSRPAVVS